jgi:hypothetical protein
MLLIGDSGTGKTGALASLARAGYRLHILDMDNKVQTGILPVVLKDEPTALGRVDYEACRDKYKSSSLGPLIDGQPQAYAKSLALLDKWTDGSIPAKWGPEHIFVLDSLTFFSDAAFAWAKGMNPSAKDPRQWFYTAQSAVEDSLSMLTSEQFHTNVIVISHVSWVDRPDGTMKGYPSSVGKALGPTIPSYFDNMAQCETVGGKRSIKFIPTALIDLKTPVGPRMSAPLPIETGLADFFKTLRS